MAEAQLQPEPHVSVATLGHVDHGKTTLTAAITKTLALQAHGRVIAYDEIDDAVPVQVQGQPARVARVEYAVGARRYVQLDCPGPEDYRRILSPGGEQLDGAIVVVSASDGAMPQTGEHLSLARRVGIPALVIFLNKMDMLESLELLDQAEAELRQLVAANGWPAGEIPVVRGSALKALESTSNDPGAPEYAPILELLRVMDLAFPQRHAG